MDQLLPKFPDYVVKGRLLLENPTDLVLKAFYFEDSRSETTNFYVTAFVLPLYVPTEFVHFTFGTDILAPQRTLDTRAANLVEALTAAMQSQGIPFLSNLGTPPDMAAQAVATTGAPEHPHVMEAVAYSLTVSQKWPEAAESLARFLRRLDRVEQHNESILAMKQRAELLQRLITANPDQALAQLQTWRGETMVNLKL